MEYNLDYIANQIYNLAQPRVYDWCLFWVAFASVVIASVVAIFTYRIYKRQLMLMQEQSTITKTQTEISAKQNEIMEQQNKISLFEHRITVYESMFTLYLLVAQITKSPQEPTHSLIATHIKESMDAIHISDCNTFLHMLTMHSHEMQFLFDMKEQYKLAYAAIMDFIPLATRSWIVAETPSIIFDAEDMKHLAQIKNGCAEMRQLMHKLEEQLEFS